MNKVKKTTLWDRLKAAARAFKGKPVGSLTFGLEIKRCDECEYHKRCKDMEGEA